MKESTIEDKMVKRAKESGVFILKNTGMRGIPDRLIVKRGRHVWVELKRPGEEPSTLQQAVMWKLRHAGAICIVVDSKPLAAAVIDAICAPNMNALKSLEEESKQRFPYKMGQEKG